jgi:hypothetical protein
VSVYLHRLSVGFNHGFTLRLDTIIPYCSTSISPVCTGAAYARAMNAAVTTVGKNERMAWQ